MIVRILGEAQREVPDAALAQLDDLDVALATACSEGEHDGFAAALTALYSRVRELGTPVPDDQTGPSGLVLPSADASLAEVSELMSENGLISQ
jgi:hypothetical protein